MHTARIPAAEYETLAAQFNPTKFDAETWLGLAKKSGVKYLVIRSKHHGGFAIYDSAVSDYDIVDAPPEERDFDRYLRELLTQYGPIGLARRPWALCSILSRSQTRPC